LAFSLGGDAKSCALLITPNSLWPLSRIMKLFKSYTSHEANRILDLRGQFWMEDYFDRYVRNHKHFTNAISYIENNPVKAGFCQKASDWRFSSAWFRLVSPLIEVR
jgi:REP element-mobilizing transposase RayT